MPHLLPDISGQLALCLPLPALVEDIDQGSFAALGALQRPGGIAVRGDSLCALPGLGHGLTFGVAGGLGETAPSPRIVIDSLHESSFMIHPLKVAAAELAKIHRTL
jgi:hypothetical protein